MNVLQPLSLLVLTAMVACRSSDEKYTSLRDDDTSNTSAIKSSADSLLPDANKDTGIVSGFDGDTAAQINKTLQFVDEFDKASVRFHHDTFSIDEYTSEGGEIIALQNNTTKFQKLYGIFFGEMGRKEFSFYRLNGRQPKLLCAIYRDISYDKPMYEKDMKISESTTTYQIYCDDKLIAMLDEQKKNQRLSTKQFESASDETFQFFKTYIGQIEVESKHK